MKGKARGKGKGTAKPTVKVRSAHLLAARDILWRAGFERPAPVGKCGCCGCTNYDAEERRIAGLLALGYRVMARQVGGGVVHFQVIDDEAPGPPKGAKGGKGAVGGGAVGERRGSG